MYDITESLSFDSIPKYLKNIREHASDNIQIILVGNNCDKEDHRIISKEQGQKMADDNGIKFYDVSIKWDINVSNTFLDLTEAILKKNGGEGDKQQAAELEKVTTENKFCNIS